MNNEFTEIKAFKCNRCGKIWHNGCPDRCSCRSPYEVGTLIGPFKITGPKVGEKIPVACLLCSLSKDLHYTALKRQKSCGCKPRWIDIIDVTEAQVRYRCNKCGRYYTEELPVYTYCCEDDDE